MKKLFVVCPNPSGAPSWYRGVGPLSQLKHPDWKLEIVNTGVSVEWSHYKDSDAVFFQRPNSVDAVMFLEECISLGKKIWLDYDDLMFDLPESSPFYYQIEENKKNIQKACKYADVISVSTEHLAEKFREYVPGKRIEVIPNAWDNFALQFKKKDFKPAKRFFWRGSSTHNEDIESHLPIISLIAEKMPDWEWWFIGTRESAIHYKIKQTIPADRLKVGVNMPLIKYFNFIRALDGGVCIVPLANNEFNRSKSNIAWQEATLAGMPTVAPAWKEWDLPGIVRYNHDTEPSFFSAVMQAIANAEHFYNLSWLSLYEQRRLSDVNDLRVKLLESL